MSKQEKNRKANLAGNSNPFTVPEGYFDTFQERLMERIETEDVKSKPLQTLIRILRPVLAMVASFVLIFFIIYIPIKQIGFSTAEKSRVNEMGIMDYYIINDRAIYEAFTQDTVEHYNEAIVEAYLMASVSDIELMELNN